MIIQIDRMNRLESVLRRVINDINFRENHAGDRSG